MKHKGNLKDRFDARSRQPSRPALHNRSGWKTAMGWWR